jgi:6-phosphogluconate dehydrogenase
MSDPKIGIYGLGTMGAALALNMADKGIAIAVSNRTASVIPEFMERAGDLTENITAVDDLKALIDALPKPRNLLAMIPSTGPMDAFLDDVIPMLEAGDTVIDAGNADFHSTRARAARLAEHDLHFVGLGVSGGEEGARHGPSMMMGGTDHSWSELKPVLEKIAAKFDGAACVDHLGPDGAGHFVKTVHNGIEYADMQVIAETYDILRNGLGMDLPTVADQFDTWNDGPLGSYLMEITAKVLRYDDPETGKPAVDVIRDSAGQKGTGRWTVIEAVKLGQSATMIEAAVAGRAWSAEKPLRELAAKAFGEDRGALDLDVTTIEAALRVARVLEYAQGFRILQAASDEYDWNLDPARIAEIWRAGCIIRAKMLDDISAAFRDGAPEGQLLLAPAFRDTIKDGIAALRQVVGAAVAAGLPVPALASALAWYDTMRQSRGTANVVQAQRDFFGRHGFERLDAEGAYHGPWWD